MANKKFSEFVLKTSTSDVSHIVGYNGAENVQITPANFVTGGGTGVFLPLAGGLMVGNTTHNDNVKSIYGTSGDGLEIFHDGVASYIVDTGTGTLNVRGSTQVNIGGTNGTIGFQTVEGANSSMRHNNVTKLTTTSTGISVTGSNNRFIVDSGSAAAIDICYVGSQRTIRALETGGGNARQLDLLASDFIFKTDAGEKMRLDSSGNLGVGGTPNRKIHCFGELAISNTADTGALLFITASDSNYIYSRAGNASSSAVPLLFMTGNSEKMRLDASGNLGIGTSTPAYKLTLCSNPNFHEAGLNTVMSTVSNQELRIISDAHGGGGRTGDIAFYTANTTTALERMRISSAGLVTINPGTASNTSYDALALTGGANSTTGSGAKLYLSGTVNDPISRGTIIEGLMTDNSNGHALTFSTSASSAAPTERMRIDSAGKLTVSAGSNIASFQSTGSGSNQRKFDISTGGDRVVLNAALNTDAATDLAIQTGGTERMRLDSSGNLLVGKSAANANVVGAELRANGQCVFTASSDNSLALNRRGSDGEIAQFYKSDSQVGNISVTGAATAYNTSSDYRLKEDLQDFKGLDLVSKIPVYDYKWKADESRSYGVMAHELEEVLPQAVTGEKDAEEMQSVDYSKIVPLLVKSIQELSAKLEALECQCEKK